MVFWFGTRFSLRSNSWSRGRSFSRFGSWSRGSSWSRGRFVSGGLFLGICDGFLVLFLFWFVV